MTGDASVRHLVLAAELEKDRPLHRARRNDGHDGVQGRTHLAAEEHAEMGLVQGDASAMPATGARHAEALEEMSSF